MLVGKPMTKEPKNYCRKPVIRVGPDSNITEACQLKEFPQGNA